MSCERIGALLPAVVDDRVDENERAALDEHLAGCAACAAELEAMVHARTALAAAGPAEPPADLAARISHSVRARSQPQPSMWERFIPIAWPAALAASVVAAALVVLVVRSDRPGAPDQATAGERRVEDPIEQVARVSAGMDSDSDSDVQLVSNVFGMEDD